MIRPLCACHLLVHFEYRTWHIHIINWSQGSHQKFQHHFQRTWKRPQFFTSMALVKISWCMTEELWHSWKERQERGGVRVMRLLWIMQGITCFCKSLINVWKKWWSSWRWMVRVAYSPMHWNTFCRTISLSLKKLREVGWIWKKEEHSRFINKSAFQSLFRHTVLPLWYSSLIGWLFSARAKLHNFNFLFCHVLCTFSFLVRQIFTLSLFFLFKIEQ